MSDWSIRKGVHLWYAKRTLKAVTEFSTAEIYDMNVCGVPPFVTQRKTPPSFTQYALCVTAFTQRNRLQLTDRTFTHKLIRLLPWSSFHPHHTELLLCTKKTPSSISFHPHHTELLAADTQDFYAQIKTTPFSNSFLSISCRIACSRHTGLLRTN